MTSTLEWPRRLAIIGTGLLGASVGLAARAAGVAEVVGADNDRRELRDALELEAITSRARSVEEAAEGADLILAATPVRSLAGVLARALAANPEAVLTDVGSTKLHLLAELQRSSANLRRVIPGHPMAGSEERGARAARVDLFRNRPRPPAAQGRRVPARRALPGGSGGAGALVGGPAGQLEGGDGGGGGVAARDPDPQGAAAALELVVDGEVLDVDPGRAEGVEHGG